MPEKVCEMCTYWGNNRGNNHDENERLKSCNCPNFFYGYSFFYEDVPNDGAAIENDEGWGMVTGPMFGCVNWKLRSK